MYIYAFIYKKVTTSSLIWNRSHHKPQMNAQKCTQQQKPVALHTKLQTIHKYIHIIFTYTYIR